MNQNHYNQEKLFENINKEYSFLDDFEREVSSQKSIPSQNREIKNETYKNNYEIPKMESEEDIHYKEVIEQKKAMLKTNYGQVVNTPINKLNSLEEAYKNLDVSRNTESNEANLEQRDKKDIEIIQSKIKKAEIFTAAFLNKEFNMLNQKMLKCCIFCYDRPTLFSISEAKLCAEKCHKNVLEAKRYVEELETKNSTKLNECIEKTKTIEEGKDFVENFANCYDNLIKDLQQLQFDVKREFSNYI
jgi:hypothetical protein